MPLLPWAAELRAGHERFGRLLRRLRREGVDAGSLMMKAERLDERAFWQHRAWLLCVERIRGLAARLRGGDDLAACIRGRRGKRKGGDGGPGRPAA